MGYRKRTIDNLINSARIGSDHIERLLPVLNSARDEEKHAQQLINDLVDKILDTGKFLIGISVPALVTIYALKGNDLRNDYFLSGLVAVLLTGVSLFLGGFIYKAKYLVPYLKSSTSRINLLSESMVSLLNYVKALDLKNPVQNSKLKARKK